MRFILYAIGVFIGLCVIVYGAQLSTLGDMEQPAADHLLSQTGTLTVRGVETATNIRGTIQTADGEVKLALGHMRTPFLTFKEHSNTDPNDFFALVDATGESNALFYWNP